MVQLKPQAFEAAKAFIFNHGRKLEQSLFKYHFESGPSDAVLTELTPYQNDDGGFGNALEPDLQTPTSSAIGTTVGFQVFREIDAPSSKSMVQKAISYLLHTYDPAKAVWPIIPPEVEASPHAPWWNYEKSSEIFGGFLSNPRAEILGYLHQYSDQVPTNLLETLTESVLTHLNTLPNQMDTNDLSCYNHLAQTDALPESVKSRVVQKLIQAAPHTVTRNPEAWTSYCLKPLWIAPAPGAPLASLLKSDIEQNLDFEIEHQGPDGAWSPFWSWAEQYPEAWQKAECAWKSHITFQVLKALHHYNRIQ